MNTNKVNLSMRRNPSLQNPLEMQGPVSWNRRLEIFKLSENNTVSLGSQEEEIDKIYIQIHCLMEVLTEKLGVSVKKKEETCLLAFKRVMKSIEKDLKDIRQQFEESHKVTRDNSEDETISNLQRQLAFFRNESLSLSKKLKVAEENIRELKRRNNHLESEMQQEHKMLLKSEKERKAIKSVISSVGNTNLDLYQESWEPSSALSSHNISKIAVDVIENKEASGNVWENRRTSNGVGALPNRKTRDASSKSIESKYKKDNLQTNSLKEELENALKKKAGFLNSEKLDELISLVNSLVSRKLKAQEQQISTLHTKIFKIKQYYQALLKAQTGFELLSGLDEILFIFWDIFTSFKFKDKKENLSKSTIKSGGIYKGISSQQNSMSPDKPDRTPVLEAIKTSNKKYSQLGIEDKLKIMQRLFDDPIVDGLLDHYAEAIRFQRKNDVSPVQQLAKVRATGSYPQTPVANDLLESDDDATETQEDIFKDVVLLQKTTSQKISIQYPSNRSQDKGRSLSPISTKLQTPDLAAERRSLIQSFRESEQKANITGWSQNDSVEIQNKTHSKNNPFERNEGSGEVNVSFSTPKGFAKQKNEENKEIQVPTANGEEKVVKDFRRRFLVKPGKLQSSDIE